MPEYEIKITAAHGYSESYRISKHQEAPAIRAAIEGLQTFERHGHAVRPRGHRDLTVSVEEIPGDA